MTSSRVMSFESQSGRSVVAAGNIALEGSL
jgi:hypothetical protein